MVDDFGSWVVAHEAALHRLAGLLTDDTHLAQDAVQATLLRIFQSWDRLAERDRLGGYARTVLVNELRMTWRRPWWRRERSTDAVPDRPDPALDPWHSAVDERRDSVWAVVSALPPRQRAVVVLRYYEQLSEAEIAEVLDVARGTVKSQASRALATLRTSVDRELLEDHP